MGEDLDCFENPMSKKVIIVGGGAAGLAAGVSLASRGVSVELFETRPYLGGRIYSFTEPVTGDTVDNGQHMFAGFYRETFKFLSFIGTIDRVARQKRLEIDFLEKGGRHYKFMCPPLPKPFHILCGLAGYSKFPKKDIFRLIKSRGRLKNGFRSMSAGEYLKKLGLSQASRDFFFSPLVLATLNADLYEVSADLFRSMLVEIFSAPVSESVLAYSTIGSSNLIANPAAKFIEERGGEIHLSTPIRGISIEGDNVSGVIDASGAVRRADAYIFAIPPDELAKAMPAGSVGGVEKWQYAPIVSVNIWYDKRVMDRPMCAFLNDNFHWCFDKLSIIKDGGRHRYVTLLASSAYDKIGLEKERIKEGALSDMKRFFPAAVSANVIRTQVITERKATVLVTPEMNKMRPGTRTRWKNLCLAGDWIDTNLPATVESAVKSGFMAADVIVDSW